MQVSDSDKCSPWHSYFQCIGSNPLSASSRFARFFYRHKILARHWHTFAHPLGRIFTYKAGFSPHIAPNGAVAAGHYDTILVNRSSIFRTISASFRTICSFFQNYFTPLLVSFRTISSHNYFYTRQLFPSFRGII